MVLLADVVKSKRVSCVGIRNLYSSTRLVIQLKAGYTHRKCVIQIICNPKCTHIGQTLLLLLPYLINHVMREILGLGTTDQREFCFRV